MTTQPTKTKKPSQLSSTSQNVRYDSNPRPRLTIETAMAIIEVRAMADATPEMMRLTFIHRGVGRFGVMVRGWGSQLECCRKYTEEIRGVYTRSLRSYFPPPRDHPRVHGHRLGMEVAASRHLVPSQTMSFIMGLGTTSSSSSSMSGSPRLVSPFQEISPALNASDV